MPCSVEDCERPAIKTGLCGRHYQRKRAHGDPTAGNPLRGHDPHCTVDGCSGPIHARRMCKKHYTRARVTADPHGVKTPAHWGQWKAWLEAQPADDECWLWPFAVNSRGYAVVGVGRRVAHVSRLTLGSQRGEPLSRWEYALHRCDTPKCVNPAHLFVGSQQDNMDDMVAKGRASWQQERKVS